VVLFVGTSLTAALGLEPEQGFPARIQAKIDSAGLPFEVVNAGVSGETSTGARGRMRWLLNQPFDVLVLETGANDMLRGTSLHRLRENLEAIVDTVKEARPEARIVLAGMVAAPNLGERYGRDFRAVYTEVARGDTLPLVPFLLEGVAGDPELNLGDGIHPNERGHRILAENVWRVLEPVLREEAARPQALNPPD
jgi:acyl-CoA thioesterase-1